MLAYFIRYYLTLLTFDTSFFFQYRLLFVKYFQVCTAVIDVRGDDHPQFRMQMAKLAQDAIDLEFLQQQCEQGCLSLETLLDVVRAVVGLIATVQSPERDESTRKFLIEVTQKLLPRAGGGEQQQQLTAEQRSSLNHMRLLESVEYIFDSLFSFVETVKRDVLNHQLDIMRAHLTRNGVGIKYQRHMFQQRIDKGEINLERTRSFVRRMMKHESAAAEGIRHVHVLSLLDILFEGEFPDFGRLFFFYMQLH
jgi:hypothetical protein